MITKCKVAIFNARACWTLRVSSWLPGFLSGKLVKLSADKEEVYSLIEKTKFFMFLVTGKSTDFDRKHIRRSGLKALIQVEIQSDGKEAQMCYLEAEGFKQG